MEKTKRERFESSAATLASDFDLDTCEADETICVKCLRPLRREWVRHERGHMIRVYHCGPNCTPATLEIGGGMECDGCGTLMPSRGRLPTTLGLMCLHCWVAAYDGDDAYGEVIYDLSMCPRCSESAVSPAWDGHCSDYCRDEAQAGQEVA